MAAIAVPLILGLVPSILQFVEQMFSQRPGSGKDKFGAAFNLTQAALTTAAAAGVISVSAANDIGAIAGLVQTTFDSMQASGQLGGGSLTAQTNVAKTPPPAQGPVVQKTVAQTMATKAVGLSMSGARGEGQARPKQSWEK